jgi:hypothetical protein
VFRALSFTSISLTSIGGERPYREYMVAIYAHQSEVPWKERHKIRNSICEHVYQLRSSFPSFEAGHVEARAILGREIELAKDLLLFRDMFLMNY